MYLPKLPFSCKVLKNFLDPLDIEGVHFTIWEITCYEREQTTFLFYCTCTVHVNLPQTA